jgi:hypothetical protein
MAACIPYNYAVDRSAKQLRCWVPAPQRAAGPGHPERYTALGRWVRDSDRRPVRAANQDLIVLGAGSR